MACEFGRLLKCITCAGVRASPHIESQAKSIIIVSYHIIIMRLMSSGEGRSGQELEQWYYEVNQYMYNVCTCLHAW